MRTLLICVLVLLARAAHAQDVLLDVPAGWREDGDARVALAEKLRALPQFGVRNPGLAVEVYVPPTPGLVLSVVKHDVLPPGNLAVAARVAVDDFHASSQRAALTGGGIVEEGWQERVDTQHNLIEATLAWRDPNARTSSSARMLIAADTEHLVSVTGECFASDDADPKLVAGCRAALATLQFGTYPKQRIPIALAPAGTRPEPTTDPTTPRRLPATMDDASRTPMPPMPVAQQHHATDRRPVYVGLGLVVLAALFWWNRQRRDRVEEESDER